MEHLTEFKFFEKKSNLNIKLLNRKDNAKTDIFDVIKDGFKIGQIKWVSRLRGYGFQATEDCSDEIKEFIKDLNNKRSLERKKNKSKLLRK